MPWSLSSYGRYKRCPANYDYRYNQKIADPAGPAAQRGTSIHGYIENYLKTGTWEIPDLSSFAKSAAETARAAGAIPEVKLAFNDKWEVVDWKDPTAWVRGVIDAILFKDSYASSSEWKSGKVWDDHPVQRNLYLVMMLSAYPKIDMAYITTVYTDLGYGTQDTMSRDMLADQQRLWQDRVAPMLADTFFSPRPGKHCMWCPYSQRKGGPCSH